MQRVLFAVIAVLSLTLFSVQAAVVYGGSVDVSPGKSVRLPIRIKENSGIMGFRITVHFDPDFLEKPTVTGAGITASGMLNDSIGTSEPGAFDVVWCADSEVKDDKDLFILGFTAAADAAGETTVEFSYSEEDTFNEQWEPVALSFTPIRLTAGGGTAERETHVARTGNPLTDRTLVDAVRAALDEYDIETFGGIDEPEQEKILERVNDLLWQMDVPEAEQPEDFGQLRKQYAEAQKTVFLEDVENTVDRQEIEKVLQTALEQNGYAKLEEVPAEQAQGILETVYSEIRDANPELEIDDSVLSGEDSAALIQGLSAQTAEEPPEYHVNGLLPVFVILLIATVAVVIVVIKRKKRDEKHEEK